MDADPFTTGEARTRLVREAQALAKLNHPHIVAVHDVGEHDGAVWLAMEYVEGETLSAWLKQRRTWREVVDVLTPAVRGLSAAHRAGLVHRDIKPDNLMLGTDGRVRVMDLGLVRALESDGPAPVEPEAPTAAGRDLAALAVQVTRAGSVLGTPAYMSPEQFRGEMVDARTDVFSLCVTLWEALMGERPFAGATLIELAANVLSGRVKPVPRDARARRVPGWLRRVCLQGLAAEPGRRFASMQALLDALSRGRARARARQWLVGVAVVAALGASVALYQRHDLAGRIAACEADGADISAVWNDEARAGVRDGILATGVSYAPVTAEKVMPFLDAQAAAWREHRTGACLAAEVEGTLNAEQLDRAVWCLDERRMEIAAFAAELSRADVPVVQKAVTAAAGLPPVSPCIDLQVLAALPQPPPADARARIDAVRATLSWARTLRLAGKFPEGLEQVRSALVDAEALGWPPLTAAVRQLEGDLLERTGAYGEAEAASLAAYMAAAKVRAWDVAATAAVDLEFNIGQQARPAEGKVWAGHAEVALSFAGDPLNLREAVHLTNLALIHKNTGAYAEAKALHERALAFFEKALGPDHPRVAGSLNNLAIVHDAMGAYAEAKALYERVLGILEKALGPDHPTVANVLNNLAIVHNTTGSYEDAKVLHARSLAISEKALGPDHASVAGSLTNLASVHQSMGAYVEAKVLHERALAIFEKALGPDHPTVANALNNLALVHDATGAYAEAKVLHERALAIWEKALGSDHPTVALSLINLAMAHQKMGEYAEAKVLYERALAISQKALGPDHPDVANALNNLANVHEATGAYAEAKALHERALAIWEKALGSDHPNVARSLNNLALVAQATDRYSEAKALFARSLSIAEKALGPDHPDVAATLCCLGYLALVQHQPAAALPLLERAVTVYDAHEGVQHLEHETHFSLARALLLTKGDRTRALSEAHKAADGFRAAGEGKAKELAEVEAFLAKHRGAP